MKVILNTDMPNLGEEGDIAEVAPGYARNFLLPKKFASLFTPHALAVLDSRKAAIEKRKEEKKKAAQGDKDKIVNNVIVITMPAGEGGKLFGSVTSANLVEELAKLGIVVEKKRIDIPGQVLKHTGDFKVQVKLYGNETAELKVQILAAGEAKPV